MDIAKILYDFIEAEALPGSGVQRNEFWRGLENILEEYVPQNRTLLAERQALQTKIDAMHRERAEVAADAQAYLSYLREIGYIVPEGDPFQIETAGVDSEILTPAPQLVVPVTNARYVLNAANARWGSLYDALYGTDVLGERLLAGAGHSPARGREVVAWCRSFLDEVAPLRAGKHSDVVTYRVVKTGLTALLHDGTSSALRNPGVFRGYRGRADDPKAVLLRHNGLHLEIIIDRNHPVGAQDSAGIADLVLEAALTTIVDFEDSVSTVDSSDKVGAYRNWLGLCKGALTEKVSRDGLDFTRSLAVDRRYLDPAGREITLPGRSLMLVRNVGLLTTDTGVLDSSGAAAPEGILDLVISVLIALHSARASGAESNRPIYIVKPKLHGPREVSFVDRMFSATEDLFGLRRNTIKLGLMDEERRTSFNLLECIRAARSRIFFINTGFLDRTGDEIHTSMEAGPVVPKGKMKSESWIAAYENRSVEIGLVCGFGARAQIGKGMWAIPDKMKAMVMQKIAHPQSGATTAWVPSPTAAVLHAIHYHQVDVRRRQGEVAQRPRTALDHLAKIPLLDPSALSADEIQRELENNLQGILGYVVRWINDGVGCSKVPDINGIGLMEDRATLRISSQHVSNWLRHGVVSQDQVMDALHRMAAIVDDQNRDDKGYRPMSRNAGSSIAFAAACDLVFNGSHQPNGYTELLLNQRRLEFKSEQSLH